jgi:hypothetical protein
MPDLELLRRNIVAFGDVAGCPLADWQAADLRLETPMICLLWGRQMGKSRALALLALQWSFASPRRRVLIVSGSGELGARRLLSEIRAILVAAPLLAPSVIDEQAGLVTLSNGSEVRAVAAVESAVRGWQVDLLLLDEAQMLSEALVAAALPATSAREGARVVLAGTATQASGPFYDLFVKGELGDPHVRSSRRVSRLVGGPDDAPWQNPSMVAAQLGAISATRADAEHRCVWQSEAGAVFTRSQLERVTVEFTPVSLEGLRPPARFLIGVDWARSVDHTAAVVVGRLAVPGEPRFAVACAKRWPAGFRNDLAIREIVESPAHWALVSAETNAVGGPLADMLFAALAARPAAAGGGRRRSAHRVINARDIPYQGEPWPWERARLRREVQVTPGFRSEKLGVHTSMESKASVWSMLTVLVDRGVLLFPAAATDLLRELLLLRVELLPSGGERIAASRGHDDLADALYLAAAPYRDARGRWVSALGRAVDHAQPASERVLPDLTGVETVRGPGGLVMPRVPAWLSVGGDEGLTLPAELTPDGARDRVARLLRERVQAAMSQRSGGTR